MAGDSLEQAILERVQLVPYDLQWPVRFEQEKRRLRGLCPELEEIEHIGSTAVPGLAAKPVIDLLAAVASMAVADALIPRLCENGYVTSAEFNATLRDRRWLMRHAEGRRTHHLHLVLPGSDAWHSTLQFRDLLRSKPALAEAYVRLKQSLVEQMGADREAYTAAKGEFVRRAIAGNEEF